MIHLPHKICTPTNSKYYICVGDCGEHESEAVLCVQSVSRASVVLVARSDLETFYENNGDIEKGIMMPNELELIAEEFVV